MQVSALKVRLTVGIASKRVVTRPSAEVTTETRQVVALKLHFSTSFRYFT